MGSAITLRRTRAALVALVVVALCAAWLAVGAKSSHALNGKILIIDTTLTSGATFNEETAATNIGLGTDVVTETQWAAMTTAQFAQYRAIVFGDPYCKSNDATRLTAPLANLST